MKAALLAAAAALAPAAAAETLGVVAVAPPPGPGPQLVETVETLRTLLAEHGAPALDARATRERMSEPDAGAAVGELGGAWEAARVAYLAGDYDRSLALLRTIADQLETLPDGAEVFALWTKVMTRIARIELDLGHPAAAGSWIERLVRAAPDLTLDPSLHPPRLVQEVERARRALADAPRATLAIAAAAPGARVYVDGRDVGTTPVRVVLARGWYRVSGSKDGATVGPWGADLRAGDVELVLDFSIPEAFRPDLGPGVAMPVGDPRLVAAGAHLGLDHLIAVGTAEDRGGRYVVASRFDVRRGVLEREGRVRLVNGALAARAAAALADFLASGRAAPGLVEVPGSEPRPSFVAPPDAAATAAPLAAPLAAAIPRSRIQLGLRLGYVASAGQAGGDTNMGEWISAQVPVQLDVLVRVSPRLSIGPYGAFGRGRSGSKPSALCGRPNASCDLAIIRVGVEATYEFTPGRMAPWLAAGIGYEWNLFHAEDGTDEGGLDVTYRGLELLNVQGGADWRLAPSFAVGPFLMASVGRYDRVSTKTTVGGTTTSAVPDFAIHVWFQGGIRARLDL